MASNMLSKSALRQMEQGRTRVGGKKIVTDDVKKLKSLAGKPLIPRDKVNDFYVEPIQIEYYIPKESRFAYETKYLYIELVDPLPKNEVHDKVFKHFGGLDQPIDVMEFMNVFPEHLVTILEYYTQSLHFYENLSIQIRNYKGGDDSAIRRILYLNEVLRKFEPTVPALELLGDYTTFNINWCVRECNKKRIPHSLEDKTVAYLIKLHKMRHEELGLPLDERFEILTQIYLEQAFPLADEELYDDIDLFEEY